MISRPIHLGWMVLCLYFYWFNTFLSSMPRLSVKHKFNSFVQGWRGLKGLEMFGQVENLRWFGLIEWRPKISSEHTFSLNIFPLAPMGVLAPRSVHTRPSARPPIDTSGNFPAHVSAESPSNISPNPLEVISEVSEPKYNFWNFQFNFFLVFLKVFCWKFQKLS